MTSFMMIGLKLMCNITITLLYLAVLAIISYVFYMVVDTAYEKYTKMRKTIKKDIDFDRLLNSFENYAQIYNGKKAAAEGLTLPEKQLLYFGCNNQDIPTIVIQWSEKGRGFGEYVFQLVDDKMVCYNECDTPEAVKKVLCMMVDQCEFLEPYKKDNI